MTTGNVLPSAHIDDLKNKLDEINHLQPDEIRKVYRQMLSTAEFSNKGGAGLGLIEMAKKTGNKLDYDFVPLDNEYSYFILSKTVNSLGLDPIPGGREPFPGKYFCFLKDLWRKPTFSLSGRHIYPQMWSKKFLL